MSNQWWASARKRWTSEEVTEHVSSLLQALAEGTLSTPQIFGQLGLSHRPTLLYDYSKPALRATLIEMAIPDKPRSSRQRYRLTARGREFLKEHTEES
jgi:ATP-dependent DNA helicase RecG